MSIRCRTFRSFKAVKSICKRCMATTRIPFAVYESGSDSRPPIGWWDEDEKRWEEGLVMCPQAGVASRPLYKWCLKAEEVDAFNNGYAVVWKESEEKSLVFTEPLKGSGSDL